jgi:hypothetical protein
VSPVGSALSRDRGAADATEQDRLFWRVAKATLLVAGVGLTAAHLAQVFSENINWDEFALFQRVANMLRTGAIQGGGRPGLVELVLAPLVSGCRDAIATVHAARMLWAGVTVVGLVGFYRLLRLARADRADPAAGAALGVALLALALPFLRWSLQVRTDQFAVTLGIWAGVALVSSSGYPWRAFLAGAGFGLGFLFTQKLVYVAVMCVILAIAQPYVRGEFDSLAGIRRHLERAVFVALGFAAIYVVYAVVLPLSVAVPPSQSISGGLRVFERYRNAFGTRLYRGLLSALGPHLLLAALLLASTVGALVLRRPIRRLIVAWGLLAAGVAVAIFHAGAFPYFWMTLGLFPAAGLGYATEEIRSALPLRFQWPALGAILLWLLIPAVAYSKRLLSDTQAVQRDALAFVERAFPAGEAGFQLEGALFCRPDPAPFPVLFREQIENRYRGPKASDESAKLISRFEKKPVRFLIVSHMIPFFPEPIRRFWNDNYLAYRGPVRLAGRRLEGEAGAAARFRLLASGTYRWIADTPGEMSEIRLDGVTVKPGQLIELAAGEHQAEFPLHTAGSLVLAVSDPPIASAVPFYNPEVITEIIGRGYRR